MWHTVGGRLTSSDISSFRQKFELTMDVQDTYDNIVASRTNIPMTDLADLRNKSGIESEMWLSTSEAEKYGCTDVIYKY